MFQQLKSAACCKKKESTLVGTFLPSWVMWCACIYVRMCIHTQVYRAIHSFSLWRRSLNHSVAIHRKAVRFVLCMYDSGASLCYFSKNSNILYSSALHLSSLNQNVKSEWDLWIYNGHFKTKWNLANYNVLRLILPGFSVKLKFQLFFSGASVNPTTDSNFIILFCGTTKYNCSSGEIRIPKQFLLWFFSTWVPLCI